MGVVIADGVAADFGALDVLGVGGEAQAVVHDVENAALNRFQSVANVGECPRHDDGHRVVEIPLAGLIGDGDVFHAVGVFARKNILRAGFVGGG